MKHLLLLFAFFALQGDNNPDYNLLVGSWMQKSFANTPDTGIFTFNADSTATLEMKKAETGDLIANIKGQYSINKKKSELTITIMGKPKTFRVISLKQDALTIKNEAEGKDQQTFERYTPKN